MISYRLVFVIYYFYNIFVDEISFLQRTKIFAGFLPIFYPWATNLSAILKGRALDALLPSDQASDYDALKTALLNRFDLTEDVLLKAFISCKSSGRRRNICAIFSKTKKLFASVGRYVKNMQNF